MSYSKVLKVISACLVLLIHGTVSIACCQTEAPESEIEARLEAEVQELQDFDQTTIVDWGVAVGPVEVNRVDVPADVGHEGVAGKMIDVRATGASVVASRDDLTVPPFDDGSAIRFRANASDLEAGEELVMEFRVWSKSRPAQAFLLYKVVIDSPGWQTFELPMQWFRPSRAAWMEWDEGGQYGFALRHKGRVLIDNIELVKARVNHPGERTPEMISKFALGETGEVHNGDVFSIVTDAPDLEPDVLMRELDQLYEKVARDFPAIGKPDVPVILIVFAGIEEYEEFWPVVADKFNATIPTPVSGGYTLFDMSTSFYTAQYGSVRPVFIHEATHALLTRGLSICGNGNWIQEGLASHYQLSWSDQDLFELFKTEEAFQRIPDLAELCTDARLPLRKYGAATLFVRWLLMDDERRAQFQALVADVPTRTDISLEPVCEQYFSMDVIALNDAWKTWLKQEIDRRQ